MGRTCDRKWDYESIVSVTWYQTGLKNGVPKRWPVVMVPKEVILTQSLRAGSWQNLGLEKRPN